MLKPEMNLFGKLLTIYGTFFSFVKCQSLLTESYVVGNSYSAASLSNFSNSFFGQSGAIVEKSWHLNGSTLQYCFRVRNPVFVAELFVPNLANLLQPRLLGNTVRGTSPSKRLSKRRSGKHQFRLTVLLPSASFSTLIVPSTAADTDSFTTALQSAKLRGRVIFPLLSTSNPFFSDIIPT
jgi:hypothetical protein